MATKFARGQRVRINTAGEERIRGKVGTIRTLPMGYDARFGVQVDECSYGKIKPDPKIGIGGAPTRATTLPADAAGRKKCPVASGVLDYFPDALGQFLQRNLPQTGSVELVSILLLLFTANGIFEPGYL